MGTKPVSSNARCWPLASREGVYAAGAHSLIFVEAEIYKKA